MEARSSDSSSSSPQHTSINNVEAFFHRHCTPPSSRSAKMTSNTAGLGPIVKLLPVTASFSAPLIALTSALSFGVVKTRIDGNTFQGESTIGGSGKKIKQPDGNEYDALLIATRIHANAMENVPITLVLAALAELNGADRKKLSAILATFSVLRVLHVIGLSQCTQIARAAGMCLFALIQ